MVTLTLKPSCKTALVILFLLSNFISLQANTIHANTTRVHCIGKEREALIKFKGDDTFGSLSSWVGSDCCRWLGVKCRLETGEVVELHLGMLSLEGEFGNSLNELHHLSYLNLSSNFFSGMIPNGFGSLKNLRVLDLSDNAFTGMMPNIFKNLSNLNYLDLSYNNFSGMISNEFGSLSNLHVLDLCSVGDESYVSDLSWLSGLSLLKFLDMSNVNLSLASQWLESINKIPSLRELHLQSSSLTTIPLLLPRLNLTSLSILDLSINGFRSQAPQWLFNLSSSVRVLKLSACYFKGPISSLLGGGFNSNLEELSLGYNDFHGELPESLGNLTSLTTLDLLSNSISGHIPKSLGMLFELKVLDLSLNKWGGIVSEEHLRGLSKLRELTISSVNDENFVIHISRDWVPPFRLKSIDIHGHSLGPEFPNWIQNQTQLESVRLRSVNISDTIPIWFWKMSSKILLLDLAFNRLTGTISNSPVVFPPGTFIDLSFNSLQGEIPLFQNVSILYLGNNQFSGTIPDNIDELMPTLMLLELYQNKLTGNIPSSLGNIQGLYNLDLSSNHFSGKVHDQWMNSFLATIDLSNNNLSGKFPASLCSSPYISELKLSNNNLHGELPSSVNECKNLTVLDLGGNSFSGDVPKWIEESLSLQQLRLRGNFFNGSISRRICRLERLHILDLALNNLSGSIPTCLGRINGMKSADQDSSQRSNLDVNIKGNTRTFNRYALKLVMLIDFSCNNLTGIIPENITDLIGLNTLNLSHNHLTGRIPFGVGELRKLETLDLSSNNFSGQIPQSMSSMTFLSNLNLTYNNLSGRIPTGNQFSTFDVSIYDGNARLCGKPLLTKCERVVVQEGQDRHNKHEEEEDDRLGLYVSIALGFAFGFWSICGSLVIKKSWRDAYFCYLVKTKDRIMLEVSLKSNSFHKLVSQGSN